MCVTIACAMLLYFEELYYIWLDGFTVTRVLVLLLYISLIKKKIIFDIVFIVWIIQGLEKIFQSNQSNKSENKVFHRARHFWITHASFLMMKITFLRCPLHSEINFLIFSIFSQKNWFRVDYLYDLNVGLFGYIGIDFSVF